MYTPTLSRNQLLSTKLKGLVKLKYNKFFWWRMYEAKNLPLGVKADLRDRINNGDFDYPHWRWQAEVCEHDLNDMWEGLYPDYMRWVEESSMMRSRRKRLIEDHYKEEDKRLELLMKSITKRYALVESQVEDMMMEWDGVDLNEFIDYLETRIKK